MGNMGNPHIKEAWLSINNEVKLPERVHDWVWDWGACDALSPCKLSWCAATQSPTRVAIRWAWPGAGRGWSSWFRRRRAECARNCGSASCCWHWGAGTVPSRRRRRRCWMARDRGCCAACSTPSRRLPWRRRAPAGGRWSSSSWASPKSSLSLPLAPNYKFEKKKFNIIFFFSNLLIGLKWRSCLMAELINVQ